MNSQHESENNEHTIDDVDLDIQELEPRYAPEVHGACVCSTSCDCSSCSCIIYF